MKTILITGTSRGIGHALSQHFLENGDFVIGCARSESAIEHSRYQHHIVNLVNPDEIDNLISSIREEHRRIDVLINNAGIASMGPVALQPPRTSRKMIDLNFTSMVHLTHGAIRLMRASNAPRIVNFSSVAVPFRLEGEAVYSATKAAVEQWTRVLAKEVGPLGITVNAIGPTPIDTDLIRGVASEKIEALVSRQAIPRWGTFADVINAVKFFLDSNSGMITGQVLYLGGVS